MQCGTSLVPGKRLGTGRGHSSKTLSGRRRGEVGVRGMGLGTGSGRGRVPQRTPRSCARIASMPSRPGTSVRRPAAPASISPTSSARPASPAVVQTGRPCSRTRPSRQFPTPLHSAGIGPRSLSSPRIHRGQRRMISTPASEGPDRAGLEDEAQRAKVGVESPELVEVLVRAHARPTLSTASSTSISARVRSVTAPVPSVVRSTVVVHHHHLAVSGPLQVDLDGAHAPGHDVLEGRLGVLGQPRREPAMRDEHHVPGSQLAPGEGALGEGGGAEPRSAEDRDGLRHGRPSEGRMRIHPGARPRRHRDIRLRPTTAVGWTPRRKSGDPARGGWTDDLIGGRADRHRCDRGASLEATSSAPAAGRVHPRRAPLVSPARSAAHRRRTAGPDEDPVALPKPGGPEGVRPDQPLHGRLVRGIDGPRAVRRLAQGRPP